MKSKTTAGAMALQKSTRQQRERIKAFRDLIKKAEARLSSDDRLNKAAKAFVEAIPPGDRFRRFTPKKSGAGSLKACLVNDTVQRMVTAYDDVFDPRTSMAQKTAAVALVEKEAAFKNTAELLEAWLDCVRPSAASKMGHGGGAR